ncbi:uncharacterized protein LOC113675065 isoform X3 [Pocillopora damicornis]|nr:uncharacterized protein LOC113675065 isoform X3 [Pocillopora damicornis]
MTLLWKLRMETVNWMYLLDPEGMLKILELALLSAAVACTAQYHKDADISNLPEWQTNRLNLFYVVVITGLVTAIFLFVSFLFNLDKRCGSPKGFTFFVTLFSLTWAVFCAVSSGLFGEVVLSLQEDKWDTSKDERIQWRYQHAQAAVVIGFLSFLAFLADGILHYRITKSTQ